MIPARMGSQRLKHKNLRLLGGIPLITRAIRKCKQANIFDEIWVNSEHSDFGNIASEEHVFFHKRPEELGNDTATHEQFVYEFLTKHSCEYLFQVHSIAPLLTSIEIVDFVNDMLTSGVDAMLSIVEEQIECAVRGKPVSLLVLTAAT
ncbi:MAG: hypothetical protein IID61_14425 [SAR324 cluster bacterium]|nr:hypothetical protein [SAR324 cluster bacterium]